MKDSIGTRVHSLEHNSTVDTKITKLAKGRNIKTQVLILVRLLIPKIKEVVLINVLDIACIFVFSSLVAKNQTAILRS